MGTDITDVERGIVSPPSKWWDDLLFDMTNFGAHIAMGRISQAQPFRAWRDEEYERRAAERELREYLEMVKEILEQERLDAQLRPMRVGVDFRMYPRYTHGPVAALEALWSNFGPFVSLILDFLPVIGQLKGIAESIIDYDITGRKLEDWERYLEDWERYLGILLSILPFSRVIFRAGRDGLRVLAKAGVQAILRGRKAEEVFRLAKVASTMTEAEIQAARMTGKLTTTELRAVENLGSRFGEMQGLQRRSGLVAASGTINNGIPTSRSAAGVIDTAAKVPGKLITTTIATKTDVARLTKVGVSTQAIAQLERVGIEFSRKLVAKLAESKIAIEFVNRFHTCPGFTELVNDLAGSARKREGALFAMAYAVGKKVNPALSKFEMGVGITKRVRGTEVAARRVDIMVGEVSHELKSWRKWTLEIVLRKPSQLVKDTAIFGLEGTKWIFNSAKISKKEVIELFKKAVTNDPYLKAKWPKGEALDRALDNIIEMFPPAT